MKTPTPHPYRNALLGLVNVVLLVFAAVAVWQGVYDKATFRLLCALFIHVVYLSGPQRIEVRVGEPDEGEEE